MVRTQVTWSHRHIQSIRTLHTLYTKVQGCREAAVDRGLLSVAWYTTWVCQWACPYRHWNTFIILIRSSFFFNTCLYQVLWYPTVFCPHQQGEQSGPPKKTSKTHCPAVGRTQRMFKLFSSVLGLTPYACLSICSSICLSVYLSPVGIQSTFTIHSHTAMTSTGILISTINYSL